MPDPRLTRRVLVNVLLVAMGSVAGAVLAEGLCRLALEPVDYLAADPVADSVLGARIEPLASGHDEWGFRNPRVPSRAEVVMIGDSQTYGIGAPASHSWPAQVARLSGLEVYNLALGGYSPVQYRELLRNRALALRPKVVVVGFYYGNDLWDAYHVVYGLKHWIRLRRPALPAVRYQLEATVPRRVLLGDARHWFATHSIAYRLLVFSALGRRIQRAESHGAVRFVHPVHAATTAFTPASRLGALDLKRATIREGLRLSLDRLDSMAVDCRRAGVQLLVALIPTKERVYEPWIENSADLARDSTLRVLLRAERQVDDQVRSALSAKGIEHLQLLAALRAAARHEAIYPPHEDGHPTAEGYAAIAQTVAEKLRPWLTPFPEDQ